MSTETNSTPVAQVEYTENERVETRKKVANVPIQVLENTLKIIEAAIQRNSFNRPDEMTFVGSNYDTLKAGLKMALDMTRKEMADAKSKKLETIDEEDEDEDVSVEIKEVPVEIKEIKEVPVEEFNVTSSLGF